MGAVLSIVITNPLDVVKTRVQNRNFDNPESGLSIVSRMVKNEGMGSFFKGVIPKTSMVGPKLIFSFTVAQSLISYFDSLAEGRERRQKQHKASQSQSASHAALSYAPHK